MKLVDYISVIFKRLKLILLNVIIITVIAIIIVLIVPKKYTSIAQLLPPLPEEITYGKEIVGSVLSSLKGTMFSTPSDLFAAILKSTTVMDGVIKDCDLQKVYKTKNMFYTYAALRKNTKVEVSPEGIITIAATARKPELARDIALSYIKNLDNVNKNLVMSIGKMNRMFLEKRLDEVKSELKALEDSLRDMQEKHKTISIEDEIEPFLKTVAEIKAQIISNEVKLGIMNKYATDDNPEIIKIKNELTELNKKLSALEHKGDNYHYGVGFSIPMSKLPKIALEIARVKRSILIQEKVFELLTEQYEKAKIQEVKDTPTVNVLVEPTIPEVKSYPPRKLIVIVSFLFSIFFSILLVFLLNWWENLSPDERDKWLKALPRLKKK